MKNKIKNINQDFGMDIVFDSIAEMESAILNSGYTLPDDGLRENRDYEIVEVKSVEPVAVICHNNTACMSAWFCCGLTGDESIAERFGRCDGCPKAEIVWPEDRQPESQGDLDHKLEHIIDTISKKYPHGKNIADIENSHSVILQGDKSE